MKELFFFKPRDCFHAIATQLLLITRIRQPDLGLPDSGNEQLTMQGDLDNEEGNTHQVSN